MGYIEIGCLQGIIYSRYCLRLCKALPPLLVAVVVYNNHRLLGQAKLISCSLDLAHVIC